MTPNFVKFKVTNAVLQKVKTYRDCQPRLLKQELSNKRSSQRTSENELKRLKDELVRRLLLVDFMHVISLFSKSHDANLSKCKAVHKKKLHNLVYFERD